MLPRMNSKKHLHKENFNDSWNLTLDLFKVIEQKIYVPQMVVHLVILQIQVNEGFFGVDSPTEPLFWGWPLLRPSFSYPAIRFVQGRPIFYFPWMLVKQAGVVFLFGVEFVPQKWSNNTINKTYLKLCTSSI